MGLFEWGERRFARGITRAMIHSYELLKVHHPGFGERNLVKLALSTRPGEAAQKISADIDDLDFWENVVEKKFSEVVYVLIRLEYIEQMKGTLDTESIKTNTVFKEVLNEEFKKAGLS